MPLSTDWTVDQVADPEEQNAELTTLRRGFMYEFKVQAYSGMFCSPDSNRKQGRIPEEGESRTADGWMLVYTTTSYTTIGRGIVESRKV